MPKNPRANVTVIHTATSTGRSIRATIPAFIAGQFKLKRGDILIWKIEGERLIVEIEKTDKTGFKQKGRKK